MKKIQYTATWFACDAAGNSRAQYEAGSVYAVTDETTQHVRQGIAVEVEVPDVVGPVDEAGSEVEAGDVAADVQVSARRSKR